MLKLSIYFMLLLPCCFPLSSRAQYKRSTGATGTKTVTPSARTLPGRNRLAAIPKKVLTNEEVGDLVQDMIKRLSPQLSAGEKAFVDDAVDKAAGKSIILSNMAVAAWYGKQDKVALMLALKGAAMTQRQPALNNVAAILNMCGYEEKAVPILANLLTTSPGNTTLLNNIGQAYFGLGDKPKAKEYFLQCIRQSPNHPEACNTMAQVCIEEGNTADAITYLEKSLRGGYNNAASNALKKLDHDYNFIPLLANHFKVPADLPDIAIPLPPQCYSVWTGEDVLNKHKIFQQKIDAVCRELDHHTNAELAGVAPQVTAQEKAGITAPFTEIGTEMFTYLTATYEKRLYEMMVAQNKRAMPINAKWGAQEQALIADKSAGGDICPKLDELRSKWVSELSTAYEPYIKDYLAVAREYVDKVLPWLPLMASCEAAYHVLYYNVIRNYIAKYGTIVGGSYYQFPCEGKSKTGPYTPNFDVNTDPACRFRLSVKFAIGKMKFDCTTFEFEGGELIKLGVKRDFISKQSTLSIGAGLGIETTVAEIGAQEGFYITFDDNQQPTDIGVKMEVKGSMGPATSSSPETANILGVTTETGVEYTMGINSGVNFTASHGNRTFNF